ncbi:MAG: hypothetical protein R6U70_09160 [Bacillota bacterium]
MRIEFELMGLLRLTLEAPRLTIELPEGARVADALQILAEKVELGRTPGKTESVDDYLVLLCRGDRTRSVQQMRGTSTPLQEGDALILAHRFYGG